MAAVRVAGAKEGAVTMMMKTVGVAVVRVARVARVAEAAEAAGAAGTVMMNEMLIMVCHLLVLFLSLLLSMKVN